MTQPQPEVNPFAFDSPAVPVLAPVTAPVPAVSPQPAMQPVQHTAPPAAAPATAGQFGDDPFSGPAPQSERPRVLDMYGRLLLIVPHKVETVPNRLQPGTTQERMTADVVVLDGGPLAYGGQPEKLPPTPHTKQVAVPHKVDRLYISQAGLVSQCRIALQRRQAGQPGGMVLGRLHVGQAKEAGQNAPYLLTEASEADKAVARQYLANVEPFA